MNNRLLAVQLPQTDVQALLDEAAQFAEPLHLTIYVQTLQVRSPRHQAMFTMSPRHLSMFLQGQDMIGTSLQTESNAFTQQHWVAQPWVRDVVRVCKERLERG